MGCPRQSPARRLDRRRSGLRRRLARRGRLPIRSLARGWPHPARRLSTTRHSRERSASRQGPRAGRSRGPHPRSIRHHDRHRRRHHDRHRRRHLRRLHLCHHHLCRHHQHFHIPPSPSLLLLQSSRRRRSSRASLCLVRAMMSRTTDSFSPFIQLRWTQALTNARTVLASRRPQLTRLTQLTQRPSQRERRRTFSLAYFNRERNGERNGRRCNVE